MDLNYLTARRARGPASGHRVLWWATICALALFLWPPATDFLNANEGVYAAVARQVMLGQELYAEAADWRPPLAYLSYLAALWASGFSLVGPHIMGLVFVLWMAVTVASLTRQITGGPGDLTAALLCVAFLAHTAGAGTEPDTMAAALCASAYLLVIRYLATADRRPSWLLPAAGVVLALAVSLKQSAAISMMGGLVACLICPPKPRPGLAQLRVLGSLGIGLVLGALSVIGLVLIYSNLGDYLSWTWVIPGLSQKVSLPQRVMTAYDLLTDVGPYTALTLGLGVAGAVHMFVEAQKNRWSTEPKAASQVTGVVLPLWFGLSLAEASAGAQPLEYHCAAIAAPVSTIAAASLVLWLQREVRSIAGQRQAIAILLLTTLISLPGPVYNSAWRWRDRVLGVGTTTSPHKIVGYWLRDHTTPDDTVAVIGTPSDGPQVLYWSERRTATRYVQMAFVWVENLSQGLKDAQALIGPLSDPAALFVNEIRANSPKYIVLDVGNPVLNWSLDTAPASPDFAKEVRRAYRPAVRLGDYQVYERIPAKPQAQRGGGGQHR